MKRFMLVPVVTLVLLVAAPGGAAGQEPTPLDRQDVERLVTGDTYTQAEVAEIVRRSCLAFRPTSDELERFRDLGASEAVLEAIRGCAAAEEEATLETLELSLSTDSLTAVVASPATIGVRVARDGRGRPGVSLVLDGSDRLPGVDERLEVRTDSAGRAAFRLPVGTTPGSYSFSVLARGFWLGGANRVTLRVLPGEPSSVRVRPERVVVEPGRRAPLEVSVAVADSFGNPVPDADVRVRGTGPGGAAGPWRSRTGPDGAATVRIPPDELAGVEELTALAGEEAAARVAVALPEPEAEAEVAEAAPAAADTADAPGAAAEPPAVDTAATPERRDEEPVPTPGGEERPPAEVAAPPSVSVDAWGGDTFDNGRDVGFRAGRLSVAPSPGVEIWGRFDHTLVLVRPWMKRGEVDFISYFGGFEVDWGAGDRFSTRVEGGRRQHAVTDEWQTLGHLRQSVRFGNGDAPAFERASVMVGGLVGDWFDRTSWGVEAGFGVPASPSFRLEGLGSIAETVAMRADPTLVSARDARFELTGRIRVAGWEVAPTGVVGSVSDSDLGEPREGELYEGRLYLESAAIGGVVRVLGSFRIQDHPESDDFSQAAVGIRVGAPR